MANIKDLSKVRAGDALPSITAPPISPVTLALFAGGSGDHNPMHLDPRFAQENGFTDVFAHGMLSMAYLGRLLTNWVAPERLREFNVRFGAITPLRAEVICSGVVKEVVEENGERLAKISVVAKLADGTETLSGDAAVAIG